MKENVSLRFLTLSILFFALLFFQNSIQSKESDQMHKYRIAFGSCLDQKLEKKIWKSVLKTEPNIWLWLGDNIYQDTFEMDEKKIAYDLQKSNVDYNLLKQGTKILGVWDDHDYGYNDVGEDYPLKNESKDLFLEFLDVPLDSVMRKREGIFSSEKILFQGLKIKLILLDTRSFRTELKEKTSEADGLREYIPNEDINSSLLGQEQWVWLEKELHEKSDLYIIASSIQVLNDTHRFEKWSNFPKDRRKLISLLEKYAKGKNLILSGDRHIAEIFEEKINSDFQIIDITSSSMNKPIPQRAIEVEDSRRKSIIYTKENFGLMEISKINKHIIVGISILGLDEIAMQRVYRFEIKKK